MHNDEVIWHVLGNQFCSYKAKLLDNSFCRNPYNVTGQCNKVSCPLSNGYYGTVIEDEGDCYLYLKTIERAHTPRNLWEKIKLSSNYKEGLNQIDQRMKNIYKDHQIHRCKLRFTRIRQTLIRMRKLQLTPQANLVPIKKKTERREATRENKAEIAARLEISIEEELLNRLKLGVYGDVYNFDQKAFDKVLDEKEKADELAGEEESAQSESDFDFVEDEDDIEEEDLMEQEEEEYGKLKAELEKNSDIEDIDNDDVLEQELDSDRASIVECVAKKSKIHKPIHKTDGKKKVQLQKKPSDDKGLKGTTRQTPKKLKTVHKGPRVEIEYEYELPTTMMEIH